MLTNFGVKKDVESGDILFYSENKHKTFKKESFVILANMDVCFDDDIDARKTFKVLLGNKKQQRQHYTEFSVCTIECVYISNILEAHELE